MILSPSHWSYDISHSFFPTLPLEDAKERINHNLMVCLMNEKQAAPESLLLSQEKAVELEYATLSKSDTRLCTLCAKRITASKFGMLPKVYQLDSTRRVVIAEMQLWCN